MAQASIQVTDLELLLSEEEYRLLYLICSLRRRGYGYQRIARFLHEKGLFKEKKLRTLAKWVERFLKRWMQRLGVSSIEELYDLLNRSKTRAVYKCRISDATNPSTTESKSLKPWVEPVLAVKHLGRTERLVLAAMSVLDRAATPSQVLAIIREYNPLLGSMLSRGAVLQAIKRLVRRGLVVPLYRRISINGSERLVRSRGYYRLAFKDYVYVENFCVDGERIWCKKLMGFPAPLSYALALASIRGRLYPIESMELVVYVRDLDQEACSLRQLGWTYTAVYYNPSEGNKVDIRLNYPPIKAHVTERTRLLRLAHRTLEHAIKTLERAINATA